MLKTYHKRLNKIIYLSVAILLGVAAFATFQIPRSQASPGRSDAAPTQPAFVDADFNPVIGGSAGQIVRSFIQADGKTIIVGAFSVLNGTNKNAIARFNTDATLDTSFNSGAGPNDSVFTVAQQADGKLLIGGLMTAYNGVSVGRIARLNLDGSLDMTFNSAGLGFNPDAGANNQIGDIEVMADGKIMIGGLFTTYNGTAISRVARLNSNGTLDNTFQVGTGLSNGEITVITAAPEGKVYIGGNFQSYNGTVSPRLARLNKDGTIDTSFLVASGANQTVRSITVQPDGKVIVSGLMTAFGGFPANGIIRLNTDGSVDQTFAVAGLDAVVIAVALQPDGKMVIGGSFTQIANATRQCLLRVNADGTNDATFDPGTSVGPQIINDIKLLGDGKLVLNGTFTIYRGTGNGGAIRINADGTLDTNLANNSAAVGNFTTLTPQADGKIIVGGSFSSVSGTPKLNFARLNADGSNDTSFNTGTGPNSTVTSSVVQPDGKVIAAGNFSQFNGTAANRIVRLNADGTIDTSFITGTGMNSSVEAMLLLADGKILVGGNFTTYNGTTVNRFMRLNTDGTLDTSFSTGTSASGIVRQITLQPDGKILIGGSFTAYNGTTRNRMARLNADGTLDTTFDPGVGPNNNVLSFALQADGSIVIGGTFNSVAGTPKTKLAKLTSTGSLDTTFDLGGSGFGPGTAPGPTRLLAVENGRTLVAGNFTTVNGQIKNRIIRVNPNGSIDHTFLTGQGAIASPALTIGSLVRQPDGNILIGGQFTIFNTTAHSGLARFKNATDTFADVDGDGMTDFSVLVRPGPVGEWTWWMTNSSNGSTSVVNFGLSPEDIPQPGDFDGDGKDDIAVWRNAPSGQASSYYIMQSSTGTVRVIPFGQSGDVAVTEDYDGDGKDDLSVWRAPAFGSTGQATWFYLGSLNNPNNNVTFVPFGMRYGTVQEDQVDEPYPGDFDGDGKADFRVQRRVDTSAKSLSTPSVFYTLTATGNFSYDYWGWAGDRLLPGDYDGDGRTDLAVARGHDVSPGGITWWIRYSSGRPDAAINWGLGVDDVFAQGDYDGDGITDLAVYRRAGEYKFYVRRSTDGGMMVYHLGNSDDSIPLANYNNR
ncbi:MAG TPA: FG-GAP-like repeat-containing protein [Pyrinomonadaceae bacterium]|nr:FG-GAP-like repeat-containing protein [Pyrinomonadaceae bacterium]